MGKAQNSLLRLKTSEMRCQCHPNTLIRDTRPAHTEREGGREGGEIPALLLPRRRPGGGAPVPKRRASTVLPSIFSSLVIGSGGGTGGGGGEVRGGGGGGENGGGDANLGKWKDSTMRASNTPFYC